MKDFIINSKQDILNLKTKWPREILIYLEQAYDASFAWIETGIFDNKNSCIEDKTHKIQKKNDKYIQLEFLSNPKSIIYKKFGFTEIELKQLIHNLKMNIL